tara:strand:+ start:342 stop:503 length:162 start_codon:yes stop_codon:yes gene_type:complete
MADKRPAHNRRNRESFQRRYGMNHSEWVKKKREWRIAGEGYKISEAMQKATRA